jgi:hypothetical protein
MLKKIVGRLSVVVMLVTILSIGALVTTKPAHASTATCSGENCNGLDPTQTYGPQGVRCDYGGLTTHKGMICRTTLPFGGHHHATHSGQRLTLIPLFPTMFQLYIYGDVTAPTQHVSIVMTLATA